MKISIIFLLIALATYHSSSAQSCSFFPADCPINGADGYGSPDDSLSRMGNPLIPQEVTMENRLRRWTASLLGTIAEHQGWQVYELSEGGASGYRKGDGSILRYDLRPPHWYYTTWEIIVNADSLSAWKAWLEDFGKQRMDAMNQYSARATAQYDRAKVYRDSADYYAQLQGQYMTDHMAQYQKDALAGNKSGIDNYERAVAAYQKKANVFIQKEADLQKDPGAEKSSADAEVERKRQTIHFHDATVVIVEFGFNMEYAKTAGSPTAPVAGTAPAWFKNEDPDPIAIDAFERSRNSVLLLEGEWNRKADKYGGYRPSFMLNNFSMDKVSDKRIKCDQVQSVDCHLSGNSPAIRQLLSLLPREEIAALIVHGGA